MSYSRTFHGSVSLTVHYSYPASEHGGSDSKTVTEPVTITVVVDDALMGISDVIRGDDHLSNTPKQIILYEALGFKIPKFYHLAMIHSMSGKKLSKRDGATDVMEYKTMGILPEALLNFLVRLGWSHGDDEIFSMQDLKFSSSLTSASFTSL